MRAPVSLLIAAAFTTFAALAEPDGTSFEADPSRVGKTYASLRSTGAKACKAACLSDRQCAGWSLVPATFRLGPRCELKSAAAPIPQPTPAKIASDMTLPSAQVSTAPHNKAPTFEITPDVGAQPPPLAPPPQLRRPWTERRAGTAIYSVQELDFIPGDAGLSADPNEPQRED